MANKVQKIREEVVRLKSQLLRGACSSQVAMETRCKEEAYNDVLGILDTMQEPVSEDLEAKIEHISKNQYFDFSDWKAIARYFANWQKDQDKQWLADNHKRIFNNGYEEGFEAGRDDMEEQLMAKAVDVTIAIPYQNSEGGYTQLVDSKKGLPFGDNIKVLVIKED